jgi:hypothetical protein
LRDAAQPPESVPEATSEHVALIDTWHEQRLQGRNPETEEPNGHTMAVQRVKHGNSPKAPHSKSETRVYYLDY